MRFTPVFPLGYMLVLFFVSSLPGTETSQNALSNLPSTLQNLLHIPAFGILALLWIISLQYFSLSKKTVLRIAIILSAAYGGVLELYQTWVPGRFSSLEDFLLNCIGILLFVFCYLKFGPYLEHFQTLKKKHPDVIIKKAINWPRMFKIKEKPLQSRCIENLHKNQQLKRQSSHPAVPDS